MRSPRRFVLAAIVTCLVSSVAVSSPAMAKSDPRVSRPLYADSQSSAAKAAQHDARVSRLAKTPQAFWATDHLSAGKVRSAVRTYANRAAKKKRTPVVAIYAIPARDCGAHSAGTFSPATYKKWVAQLASGLKGKKAIAILEPDALAMLDNCAGQGDRTGLLRYAAKKLKSAGVWVYLDAGHSNWIAPDIMAARLRLAGVKYTRGIATNVANFQSTAVEKAYASRVLAEVRKLKITGKRYVIDTSRNGSTDVAPGEFCNPPGARVGAKPRVFRKGTLQAYVWVKNPGESDGPCNGGPAAGMWWNDGARQLIAK